MQPVPQIQKAVSAIRGPMNPALAVFVRIVLGGIALAFYTAIFAFVVFLVAANLLVSRADAYVWGGSSHRAEVGARVWQNKMMWMWFDGFVAVVKYIFVGGSTDVFVEFIHAVKHPLIKVAGDYWDQETKRL